MFPPPTLDSLLTWCPQIPGEAVDPAVTLEVAGDAVLASQAGAAVAEVDSLSLPTLLLYRGDHHDHALLLSAVTKINISTFHILPLQSASLLWLNYINKDQSLNIITRALL